MIIKSAIGAEEVAQSMSSKDDVNKTRPIDKLKSMEGSS